MDDSVFEALALGQVIAHPTETVFGLAADPFHPDAIARLISLKGRCSTKGFIVLIPDQAGLKPLVDSPSALARQLMDHFWPGPLTLILPARAGLPVALTGQSQGIAVRHSSSPVVTELLHRWQKPLISTSANLTGYPPLCSAAEVRKLWGEAIPVVLEGHTPVNALPSTILHITANRALLVRVGAVSVAELRGALPEMELIETIMSEGGCLCLKGNLSAGIPTVL